jgi:hypothetical protein
MTGRVTIAVTVEIDVELPERSEQGSISSAMDMASEMAKSLFVETLAKNNIRTVSTVIPRKALIVRDLEAEFTYVKEQV